MNPAPDSRRFPVSKRWLLLVGLVAPLAGLSLVPAADPAPKGKGGPVSDIELVEKLNATRKQYQLTLEQLRHHYMDVGDIEKAKWAEDELRQYHRMVKYAYRLDIDVPVPTLQAKNNIPEANELFREAMKYKDKGFGETYT